jgi:hypothetical protein
LDLLVVVVYQASARCLDGWSRLRKQIEDVLSDCLRVAGICLSRASIELQRYRSAKRLAAEAGERLKDSSLEFILVRLGHTLLGPRLNVIDPDPNAAFLPSAVLRSLPFWTLKIVISVEPTHKIVIRRGTN